MNKPKRVISKGELFSIGYIQRHSVTDATIVQSLIARAKKSGKKFDMGMSIRQK